MSGLVQLDRTTAPRNGLIIKPYVYRGTGEDTLTPELESKPAAPKEKPRLAPCGTESAYRRHRRRREPIDLACHAANARATADYRARKNKGISARLQLAAAEVGEATSKGWRR